MGGVLGAYAQGEISERQATTEYRDMQNFVQDGLGTRPPWYRNANYYKKLSTY